MPADNLRSAEQRKLVEQLAELAQSGMPLPSGLRAAADETKSLRLASHFRNLASNFEAGANWDAQSLDESNSSLPPHVLGAIRAGIQSGNLGEALDGLVDQDRSYREVWRELWLALAYPILLVFATMVLFLLSLVLVVRPMKEVYGDFGMELPLATQFWISLSNELPRFVAVSAMGVIVVLVAIRILGGRVGWSRFVSGIPVFGTLIHLAGVSQMLRLLEVMLAQQMPLAEALRLTSSGAADANMQFVSRWFGKGVEAGVPLSRLIESTPRIPPAIVPIIAWGEKHGALPEAIRSAYEMLEGRIRTRGSSIATFLGPLMLMFVGISMGFMAISLFMPLFAIIQNLT